MIEDPATPECDKWAAASDRRDTVRDFLDFLREQGVVLYEQNEGTCQRNYWGDLIPGPCTVSEDDLIYRFVEVDPLVLDAERRSILDWVQDRSQQPLTPDERTKTT